MAATVTRETDHEPNTREAGAADPRDPRAVKVVAKSIYRELVESGFREADVMALAGELLALVASGVREKRES